MSEIPSIHTRTFHLYRSSTSKIWQIFEVGKKKAHLRMLIDVNLNFMNKINDLHRATGLT